MRVATGTAKPWVILPEGPGKLRWDALVSFCTIYFSVEVPLRIAFSYAHIGWLVWCDLAVLLVFITDMVLRFRTALVVQGRLVTDLREIRQDYLRGWFWVDLLGTLPFHLIFIFIPFIENKGVLDWTDLLRLARLWQITMAFVNRNPQMFQVRRLGVFLFWVGLIVHLIATGWVIVGGSNDQGEDTFTKYWRALYWTITTVSTTGYGDITPKTNLQTTYAMGTMVLGATFYAAFIGNIASLLTRLDGARAAYQDKLERLTAFFRYKGLPVGLRKKILQYHAHIWTTGRGYDEESVLAELPNTLRQAVTLELNHKILQHMPLFKGAAPAVLEEIAAAMRPIVFTPSDFVMHAGEVGHSMFFISKGHVEVLGPDGTTRVAGLKEGDYFGEIALLENVPRSASIRALDFCTLYELEREPFALVLEQFPDFAADMRSRVASRKKA